MLKKLLLATTMIGISSAAYAADDGFYVGVQGGYTNNGFSSTDAFMPTNGIGSQNPALTNTATATNRLGFNTDISQHTNYLNYTTFTSNCDTSNFGGKFFLGYQFNPYFATELGYNKFTGTDDKATGVNVVDQGTQDVNGNEQYKNVTDSMNASISEQAVDLNAKLIYPVDMSNFNVYVKAGVAYLQVDQTGSFTTTESKIYSNETTSSTDLNNTGPAIASATTVSLNQDFSRLRPTGAIGAGYDFTPNMEGLIEASYIFGSSNVPDLYVVSIGASYHFA